MATVPIGSLIGLGMVVLVVGIVLGRSSKFMRRMGEMHASAHGGNATGGSAAAHQSVSTVVVVDRDGVPLAGGRYDLDALATGGVAGTVDVLDAAPVVGELVASNEDADAAFWSGHADSVAAQHAYRMANEHPR